MALGTAVRLVLVAPWTLVDPEVLPVPASGELDTPEQPTSVTATAVAATSDNRLRYSHMRRERIRQSVAILR
ncbi:hypothetical protein GCM10011492_37760 [Flexivirga endophytica]|uniref:Uncharacterized protein n=1 Tax=Flexivirga endophytica TaxID=1849103 RepID=A0A916TIG3_9MICO|nr:hypothetical protein GCM10011492_37760 [Flexivirga endophytica]GHB64695.1 hypothetical protein GCM10008112_37110 [Flexivirga endophytica]